MNEIEKFVRESNRIEGITRNPKISELNEFRRFFYLRQVQISDLIQFVTVYQRGARLRDQIGLNVIVSNHIPPRGGPAIREALEELLIPVNATYPLGQSSAFTIHCDYERLHPFTDGNGRSGRMLWAWMMQDLSLGFLHRFYYQTLADYERRKL